MQRQDDTSELKANLEAYLVGRGIDPTHHFRCLNPDHPDKHPSMVFYRDSQRVKCFSCGKSYDLIDLIAIEYGLETSREAFEKTRERYGGARVVHTKKAEEKPDEDPQAIAAYLAACRARIGQTDYLERRGISPETAARFGLGYDPAFTRGTGAVPWRALIIPTGETTFTARNTSPDADRMNRVRKTGGAPIYNAGALAGEAPVFVVEGEIDALSLAEAGAEAVALGGVAGVRRLIDLARDTPPAAGMILSLDNDDSGQKAQAALLDGLRGAGIPCTEANIAGEHNDPNEALTGDREAFIARVAGAIDAHGAAGREEEIALREAYARNSAASHLQAFVDGIAQRVNTPCIPTGFKALDDALDGGLYEGLYILGAITSLGKTTFALQIADQIAQSGTDVLIFSLEMARSELMAKSISRLSICHCLAEGIQTGDAKTARGITEGRRYPMYSERERGVIREAVRAYGDYAGHVYISEGIGDIGADEVRRSVQEHIRVTGQTPVVFIDYLQIMAPHDIRATDKQNTDKAVLELKRISRDFKLPVVGISSFNRENYKNAVSMVAFKESGAIEYSSDVLIGLQLRGAGDNGFDAEEAKRQDPRRITLKVLKNRNGAVGAAIDYDYYPRFNYFREGK